MNKSKYILIFFSIFVLLGCDNDDDSNNSTNNEFTIQGTDYPTPNGYLILDDGPLFTNAFMFAFLESIMVEDNINGSSLATDNTHGIVLQVKLGNTPVNAEQDVTNSITNNSNFTLTDESSALTNITMYTNIYTNSGVQYGNVDMAGTTAYEIGNSGNGTLTVNTFTVDLTTRTGTVDCTYTMVDENNVSVIGQFNGTFKIINEF